MVSHTHSHKAEEISKQFEKHTSSNAQEHKDLHTVDANIKEYINQNIGITTTLKTVALLASGALLTFGTYIVVSIHNLDNSISTIRTVLSTHLEDSHRRHSNTHVKLKDQLK